MCNANLVHVRSIHAITNEKEEYESNATSKQAVRAPQLHCGCCASCLGIHSKNFPINHLFTWVSATPNSRQAPALQATIIISDLTTAEDIAASNKDFKKACAILLIILPYHSVKIGVNPAANVSSPAPYCACFSLSFAAAAVPLICEAVCAYLAAAGCTAETSTTTRPVPGSTSRRQGRRRQHRYLLPLAEHFAPALPHGWLCCWCNTCMVGDTVPGSKEQVVVHRNSLGASFADHGMVKEGRCGLVPAIERQSRSTWRHVPKSKPV
jgi:hypothetical protein